MNDSKISNCIDEIYYVCNEPNIETVPRGKRDKYHRIFLTDDDRTLSVSRNLSNNFKWNFTNHKHKHNVSLNLFHEINTKNIEYFMVDHKQ